MKKLILLTILILSTMSVVNAQSRSETDVANAVEQLRNAMVNADSLQLDKLVLAKLSYGHSSGQIDDKAIFVQKLVTGKSDFVTLSFKDQAISVNKNVAIVRHKLDAVTNDNGKPGEVHLAVLLIWQKQHGNWKLLARQAIKIQ
ncbi:MAG: nuclear transport factor 2 family protein [Ferruginibacter sp.]